MKEKNLLLPLFKEQLENDSQAIAKAYGLGKRGDFLTWWYFIKLRSVDASDINDIVVDGSNDLGIDAIEITGDNVVHFYQFKNPESITKSFPGGDVDKILSGFNLLISKDYHKIANEDLQNKMREVNSSVREGYQLHLVISGQGISRESEVKLASFSKSLKAPSDSFFTYKIEDLSGLQEAFYKKSLPTVEEAIIFPMTQAPYYVRSSKHECYFFHASGVTLASLYETHGEQLLQQNIRIYQSDKNTNSSIKHTCTNEDSDNFLHFNNGVTFLCENATWDHFANTIQLKHAQIVNGGQTTRILSKANSERKLKEDVLVPIRVITSQGDKDFSNKVTVNLNNQNRMKSSFLRSNDPSVIVLSHALLSLNWYLERREGEIKSLSAEEKQAIETKIGYPLDQRSLSLEEATKAYVSMFLGKPEIAKKFPGNMFLGVADGGEFENIFNDIKAENYVLSFTVKKSIDHLMRDLSVIKRKRDDTIKTKEFRKIFGARFMRKHASSVEQITPSGSEFICAVLGKYSEIYDIPKQDVCSALEHDDYNFVIISLDIILSAAAQMPHRLRWTSLFQAQHFFDRVVADIERKAKTKSP